MKITINREELLIRLKEINKIIEVKSLNKERALTYLKFVPDKNALYLYGFNFSLNINAIYKIELEDLKEKLIIGVNGKLLQNLITKLKTETLNFEFTKESLKISNSKSKLKLTIQNFDEVPNMKTVKDEEVIKVKVKRSNFLNSISNVIDTVLQNDTRPLLEGISFKSKKVNNKNLLELVTIDGYRMSLDVLNTEEIEKEISCVVHAKFLYKILNSLSIFSEEELILNISNASFVIENDLMRLKTLLLEGDFVNYTQFLPSSSKKKFSTFEVNRKEFLESLEVIKIISENGIVNSNGVFIISEKESKLKIETINVNSGIEFIEIKNKENITADIRIGFNINYFIHSLKILKADKIKFLYTTNSNQMYLIEDTSEIIQMILPVREKVAK